MAVALPIVGITGHQGLDRAVQDYVTRGIRKVLLEQGNRVVGATSLAAGADQLFAGEVLRAGGQLRVVVPSEHYISTFGSENRAAYEHLLGQADTVEQLPFASPTEQAFLAAGHRVADLSEVLVAVWDGEPARGTGGTGDVVAYARSIGVGVEIVWPAGVKR